MTKEEDREKLKGFVEWVNLLKKSAELNNSCKSFK